MVELCYGQNRWGDSSGGVDLRCNLRCDDYCQRGDDLEPTNGHVTTHSGHMTTDVQGHTRQQCSVGKRDNNTKWAHETAMLLPPGRQPRPYLEHVEVLAHGCAGLTPLHGGVHKVGHLRGAEERKSKGDGSPDEHSLSSNCTPDRCHPVQTIAE